jgi:hypothetical protein
MTTMRHPSLPGQSIDVDPSAVPFHAAAGWTADPVPTPNTPVPGDKAGDDTDKPAAKSRARRSKEGESA